MAEPGDDEVESRRQPTSGRCECEPPNYSPPSRAVGQCLTDRAVSGERTSLFVDPPDRALHVRPRQSKCHQRLIAQELRTNHADANGQTLFGPRSKRGAEPALRVKDKNRRRARCIHDANSIPVPISRRRRSKDDLAGARASVSIRIGSIGPRRSSTRPGRRCLRRHRRCSKVLTRMTDTKGET